MQVEVSETEQDGLSEETIRNLVHRHVLRTTVQALINAEWNRFQAALSGKENSEPVRSQVVKKIGSPLGKIKIEMPNDLTIKFRSCILCSSQRELNIPVERLLKLPFVDNESELRRGLEEIFGEEMPIDLTKTFVNCLSDLLQCDQGEKLAPSYSRAYFGKHNVLGGEGDERGGLIDYCILRDSTGHHFVCGIWDPLGGESQHWRDVAVALKRRGLSSLSEIITDGSVGTEDLKREFSGENSDPLPLPDDTLTDDTLDDIIDDAKGYEWSGRSSDPIFDPPMVEQMQFAPPVEAHVDVGAVNEDAARYALVRDVVMAFAGALVLTLVVVSSFQFAAHSLDFKAVFTSANFALFSKKSVSESLEGSLAKNAPLIEAIERTGELDDPSVQSALMSLSAHRDYRVRIAVIRALAGNERLELGERVAFLGRMLSDGDFLVRGYAAKTLGQLRTPEAFNILRARMSAEDNQVVLSVIEKLLKS